MKYTMAAIALAIATPAFAQAQPVPDSNPSCCQRDEQGRMACCENMEGECCQQMGDPGESQGMDHDGHDMDHDGHGMDHNDHSGDPGAI
jgi:hypothetical protein